MISFRYRCNVLIFSCHSSQFGISDANQEESDLLTSVNYLRTFDRNFLGWFLAVTETVLFHLYPQIRYASVYL